MKIKIELYCPHFQGTKIKNGWKSYGKQNYLCKNCGRQFTGDHALDYKGCHSSMIKRILSMMVRGIGVRDISVIEGISIVKVLSVSVKSCYVIKPKRQHYTSPEVDEFWTYVGEKKNKVWLIYACDRKSGEIVSFVWGKRDLKTARKLRKKFPASGVSYDRIRTDNRENFIIAFQPDNHIIGKKHTAGIEGNNCRLRHRIRRAFRKTCCSLKLYAIT
jgi:IS1 family transposase/transposase-like protein